MPPQKVAVSAPGFEDFEAVLIPGLHNITFVPDAEPKSVVVCPCADRLHIVPSRYVTLLESS